MKARRHLTWPCGMHEEIELEGIATEYDDTPGQRPCPLHALTCHRGAGQPPKPAPITL